MRWIRRREPACFPPSILPVALLAVVLLQGLNGTEARAQAAGCESNPSWAIPPACWREYGSRAGIGYDVGEQVGSSGGYATFEGFVPLIDDAGRSLLFSDLRLLLYDESEVGANVGLGYRWHDAALDCTFGTFLYYDNRQTGWSDFHQLALGLEALGPRCDFRANVYLPGPFSDRKAFPDRFSGHYLFIDRSEAAMTGLDMELGVPLRGYGSFQPQLVTGGYHFQASDAPNVWGWKTRVEAELSDTVSMDLGIHADRVFGASVNFGITWRFPGTRSSRRGCPIHFRRSVCERLRKPVERLQNIVVYRRNTIARDTDTGDPIFFLHVAPGGNSDGSFEDPHATLADALADSRYSSGQADVIYVRQGPTAPLLHAADVSMQPDSQLLSNGPIQRIDTQLGLYTLPFSGADPALTNLPQIVGNVTLADRTTFAGFDVLGGVASTGAGDLSIAENSLSNPAGEGVSLAAAHGFLHIGGNRIGNCATQGILVDGSIGEVEIRDNTITGSAEYGIMLSMSTLTGRIAYNAACQNDFGGCNLFSTDFTGTIDHNTLNDNGSLGFYKGGGIFQGEIRDNVVSGNRYSGIKIYGYFTGNIAGNTCTDNDVGIDVGYSTFTGDITGNDISHNRYVGLEISTPTLTGNISHNTISDNQEAGIYFTNAGLVGDVVGNEILGNGDHGMLALFTSFDGDVTANRVEANDTGLYFTECTIRGNIMGNTITGNRGSGIYLFGPGSGHITGDVRDNVITDNGNRGIGLRFMNAAGSIAGNSLVNNATGIRVDVSVLRGDITGNTINQNTNEGIYFSDSRFDGEISDNTAEDNGNLGIDIKDAAGTSVARMVNNRLSGNNGGTGTEMRARIGEGTLYMELEGNSSTNVVPDGYNYDFYYYGSGSFFLDEGTNVGTVGNSAGTFPDPWIP